MFTIHVTKYHLIQTQNLFLLGFSSYKMAISSKKEKKQKITIFRRGQKKSVDLATAVGNSVSSFGAV